ncbi:hypothetical protein [Kineococcus aurantiacus]|uniref:Uncharacterized protein n=1 Tax=Kineococcus aurantiacus TaxID=37633 RepID=A0A7Y9DQR7_9ACTN|nr:hypothetical protein [Kineococcus aurantiacus]NYD25007.1 hypothetical protein [Kineococcus aurantiacus]
MESHEKTGDRITADHLQDADGDRLDAHRPRRHAMGHRLGRGLAWMMLATGTGLSCAVIGLAVAAGELNTAAVATAGALVGTGRALLGSASASSKTRS